MVLASKKICPSCSNKFYSSEEICMRCRDEFAFKESIKGKSKEELLEMLKKSFEEDDKENFKILNMIFEISKTLDSEFVLNAIYAKLESDLEDGEIDEHLIEDAEMAMDLLNNMYVSCFCGWTHI